jgi:hypothetical protein
MPHLAQDADESVERRWLLADKSCAASSERQVVARKRSRRKQNCRNVACLYSMDVFEDKMIVGVFEVRAIHFELFRTDVVRVSYLPASTFQADSHQADSSEELGERSPGMHGQANHEVFLTVTQTKRTLFMQRLAKRTIALRPRAS